MKIKFLFVLLLLTLSGCQMFGNTPPDLSEVNFFCLDNKIQYKYSNKNFNIAIDCDQTSSNHPHY